MRLFSQSRLFGQANMPWRYMPTGADLAFAACLWGMPWPSLCAIALVASPMCVALNLAVRLCHSYFPTKAVMALGACS